MEDPQKIDKLPAVILIGSIIIAAAAVYVGANRSHPQPPPAISSVSEVEALVIPAQGVELPVRWGNLGMQLVQTGVIDRAKFTPIADSEEYIRITEKNAGQILNSFWALGLGNKNDILETGEMMYPRYGGADRFASTAGWTIAKGNPMDHYSRHSFVALTGDQQALVDKIARGIYRPCCGNSTHFPDCNHGMAMLGLLELMASQGAGEQDMWEAALAVNSYWFPDAYTAIAQYMQQQKNTAWSDVDPREALGSEYSSAEGYRRILANERPKNRSNQPSCNI